MVCSAEGLLCDVPPLIFPLRLTVWTTKAKQLARTLVILRGAADGGPGQKGATTNMTMPTDVFPKAEHVYYVNNQGKL